MSPSFIIYAKGDNDVKKALAYARKHHLAVAVRTGGHQYSGASSTWGDNIQLDLSATYPEFEWNDATGLLRVGISHSLIDFNTRLGELGLFIPHGLCSHVHLGGHVQTGGYGMLGRSCGLFSDYVESFEIITANGHSRVVRKSSTDPDDKDLFFAVLGGSPGNFGVLTHITVRPFRDREFDSRGLKMVWMYSREVFEPLLQVVTEMCADADLDPGIDVWLTVFSSSPSRGPLFFPNIDAFMAKYYPDLYGQPNVVAPSWPSMIGIYAQWVSPKSSGRPWDPTWFDRLKTAAGPPADIQINDDVHTDVSVLMKAWVLLAVREFELPYEKRTYMTNKTDLRTNGWIDWISGHIDSIENKRDAEGKKVETGCKLSIQIQSFSGKGSKFRLNAIPGTTSFSWRTDATICCVLDCFYDPEFPKAKKHALAWQKENGRQVKRTNNKTGLFAEEDRRIHWASFGHKSLDQMWRYYYDSEEKYRRIVHVKKSVDPQGVFTPNTFCVGKTDHLPPVEAEPRHAFTDVNMAPKLLHRLNACSTCSSSSSSSGSS